MVCYWTMNCFSAPTPFECVNLGMSVMPLSTSPNKHIQKYQRENKEAENRPVVEKKVIWSTLREIVLFLLILAFWWSLYSAAIVTSSFYFWFGFVLFYFIIADFLKQTGYINTFLFQCLQQTSSSVKVWPASKSISSLHSIFWLVFFSFEKSLMKP